MPSRRGIHPARTPRALPGLDRHNPVDLHLRQQQPLIYRILGNKEVQRYLNYLDDEYREYGPPSLPRAHDDARDLFEEIGRPVRY
jgi:hypothetical protein